MKLLGKLLAAIFLLASCAFGQGGISHIIFTTGAGANSALFPGSQWLQDETIASCSSGSTSCTAGTGSCGTTAFCPFTTTAGSTGIITAGFGTGTAEHITSAYLCTSSSGCNSGNAIATATLCPASACVATSSTNGYGNDLAYYLNGPSGGTYITVNVSGTGGQGWGIGFHEHLPPSGYTESYSSSGHVAGGSNDTCSTCTGGTPTTSSTPLNVFEFNDVNPSTSEVPMAGYGSPWIMDVSAVANCFDCTNPSAPSFTFTGGGTGTLWYWISFAMNASYTVQAPITVVQHTVLGTAVNCSSSCTVTVPSTGSGNLLYLHALTTQGSTPYISTGTPPTDGTSNFTVPTACQSGTSSGGVQSSCAYLLSSNSGKTTITVNISPASTSAFFSYWELHKTGSWNFDTAGCTQNTASNFPPGQTLILNNTTTPHAIFESINMNNGAGAGGVTYFPLQFNSGNVTLGSGYVGSIDDNSGYDVLLLNTRQTSNTWSQPQASPTGTGACAEAFY